MVTFAPLILQINNSSVNFDVFLAISENIAKDYLRLIYLDTICMNMFTNLTIPTMHFVGYDKSIAKWGSDALCDVKLYELVK